MYPLLAPRSGNSEGEGRVRVVNTYLPLALRPPLAVKRVTKRDVLLDEPPACCTAGSFLRRRMWRGPVDAHTVNRDTSPRHENNTIGDCGQA